MTSDRLHSLKFYLSSAVEFFIVSTLFIYSNEQGVLCVFLSMWTQGQVSVLNVGQSLELECEFHSEDYNMFSNPVVWKKFQRHEQTDVNIMGNILVPFLSTGRFLVTFTNNSPRYRMRLRITDLALEDSGNYTCDIRGTRGNILGSVTHYLFVRAPVQSVYFVTWNSTVQPTTGETPIQGELTFTDGQPASLRCVSLGGYPPPNVLIARDGHDVSDRFTASSIPSLVGEKGLRLMMYRTERWNDHLTLSPNEDGAHFRCTAVVSDIGSLVASIKVLVNYAPLVHCFPALAEVGERNVYLSCEVRSRPGLTSLYWEIDSNGTTVSEGRVREEYWTLAMVRTDDVIETRLFMRKTTHQSFRKYSLYAENAIDSITTETSLIQKHSITAPLTLLELRHHNGNLEKSIAINKSIKLHTSHASHDVSLTLTFDVIVFVIILEVSCLNDGLPMCAV